MFRARVQAHSEHPGRGYSCTCHNDETSSAHHKKTKTDYIRPVYHFILAAFFLVTRIYLLLFAQGSSIVTCRKGSEGQDTAAAQSLCEKGPLPFRRTKDG